MRGTTKATRCCLLSVTTAFVVSSSALGGVEVHFINLGHGDCTLIRTAEGKSVLIDAGLGIMSWKLKRYLKRQRVHTIDLLVLTHADPDHYGGMKTVIKNFEVKEFVEPGIPAARKTLSSLLRLVEERGIRHTVARRGETFTLGDVTLRVLSPPARPLEKVRSPINANSIVLRLSTEGIRMLFAGDIEAETEEFLVGAGDELTADVLKVPHHGVSTSSTPAFLDAVKPRYAVITCAYYAEPSRELYDRFEERRIAWFRNDANGTVVFSLADGTPGALAVSCERGEENSRLKVAPDWFKLLRQITAIPPRAKRVWAEEVRERAIHLGERVQETYEEEKERLRRRLPGFIRRRLERDAKASREPAP